MTTGKYAKGDPGQHGPRGPRGPAGGLPVRYVSNRVRIGLHARNDYTFTELDYRIIREAKIETLKTMSHTQVEVYKRLRKENPDLEFIVRLYDDRMGKNHQHPSPADFAAKMIPTMQALKPYAVKFEIHNEPNHEQFYEGWGPGLDDARSFNQWFLEVYRLLKKDCPWAQLGFPGLALHHGAWRGDLDWLQACAESVRKADWLGVHCYWQQDNQLSPDWGRWFIEYHTLFPDKMLEMTEFGNSTANVGRDVVARHYAAYYDVIQRYGLYLRSAAAFLATSPDPGWDAFCWGNPQNNQCYEVVGKVGQLPRTEVVDETPIDQVAGIVDLRGRLPVRKGADGKPQLPYFKRDVNGIKYIVIHHSTGRATLTAENITNWDVTHQDEDKPEYPEASYHFVVEQSGRIVRQHSLDVLAWHAGFKGQDSPGDIGINNWQGVAICLIGNFMSGQAPTDAQLRSAARLCQAIMVVLPQIQVIGHRELGPPRGTECPGDTWLGLENYKGVLLKLIGNDRPVYAFELTHQTPVKMDTGATIKVPVTLKNTGIKTWMATGMNAVSLSYHWADAAGKKFLWESERTHLPGPVLPGQEVTLEAQVQTPPFPGDYKLQWDVVEERITWFSDQKVTMPQPVAVQVTGDPKPLYAYTLAQQPPAVVDCNATLTVPVTLKNTGRKTWLAGGDKPIRLSYHWADAADKIVIFEGERTDLPADVARGGEVTLQAKVKAPAAPGAYVLQWDPVEEHVTWFSDQLARVVPAPMTARLPITTWAVTASVAAAEAGQATDGRFDTAWSTPGPQASGAWFQVDLGSLQLVRSFRTQSLAGQFARGYVVKVSADGASWQEVARESDNRGDVDVSFAPAKARYVRIELLLPSWTISEVVVQAEPIVTWKATASHCEADAGKALDGDPDTAWSTAAGQTPGMWFQVDLGGVQHVTRIALTSPRKEQTPRGYKISVSTDGQNWNELTAKPLNYSNPVEVTLGVDRSLPAARYVRIETTAEDRFKNPWSIGELVIRTTPAWTAKASFASAAAGKAIDGDPATAWSSGVPQTLGMWYELDLGAPLTIAKVVLEGPAQEFPRGLAIELSADGAIWREVGRVDRFFRTPAAVSFDPTDGCYIRIKQTSDAVQVGKWKIPWTIGEVQVFGTAGA
ncbi:MAG: discoidin domain-containing protein [Chloroflexi bacterium]|nr:discoidin domain-containing protein [Chloroflexota bacterium]